MAKNLEILAVVLAFSYLLSSAYCGHQQKPNDDKEGAKVNITVEGLVYCDPCRVQFQTRVSKPIKGAKVKLECRNRDNEQVVLTKERETDDKGMYKIPVHHDFQEQICEVTTIDSPDENCKEKFDQNTEKARVVISKKDGLEFDNRIANPIGFMMKETSDECKEVIKELFPDVDDMPEEYKKMFGF